MEITLVALEKLIIAGLAQSIQYTETTWWKIYKYLCFGVPNAKLSEKTWIVSRSTYDETTQEFESRSFPLFSWQWCNEPKFAADEASVKAYLYHDKIA